MSKVYSIVNGPLMDPLERALMDQRPVVFSLQERFLGLRELTLIPKQFILPPDGIQKGLLIGARGIELLDRDFKLAYDWERGTGEVLLGNWPRLELVSKDGVAINSGPDLQAMLWSMRVTKVGRSQVVFYIGENRSQLPRLLEVLINGISFNQEDLWNFTGIYNGKISDLADYRFTGTISTETLKGNLKVPDTE